MKRLEMVVLEPINSGAYKLQDVGVIIEILFSGGNYYEQTGNKNR